jgi:hypothetical protein
MVEMLSSATNNFASRAEDCRRKGEAALKGSFFANLLKSKEERQEEAKEFF